MRRNLLLTLIAVFLVAALIAGFTWSGVLNSGSSGPETFQRGPIAGIPAYPGGAQLSGALDIDVPTEMSDFIGTDEASWAVYRTGDALEDIEFFYLREMKRMGYRSTGSTTPNLYTWNDGDLRYAVFVSVERVQNLVVLASSAS